MDDGIKEKETMEIKYVASRKDTVSVNSNEYRRWNLKLAIGLFVLSLYFMKNDKEETDA